MAKRKPSNDAVTISYYIESPIIRSQQRIKPHPFSQNHRTTRKCGYDRRAELLAYANELRKGDPQQVHWSRKCSNPKPKKWKWSATPGKIRVLFLRIFRAGAKGRWKYERMVSEEGISGRKKKKKSLRDRSSHFWKKLKCVLKELSFTGKCNKG